MTGLPETYANEIENLAAELAEAMTESTAALATVDSAEEHRSAIAGRVAALAAERAAIVGRRRTGRHDQDDGAALALNLADQEGLQPLLQEAAARVQEAEAQRSAAAARAANLRAQITHVEAQAAREALVRHADALSEKMLETLVALEDACRQTGHTGRPVWGPPPALYQRLRGLAAQRGEL
jgi:hypothetical protein